MQPSERVYRSGYALMVYNPSHDKRTWKYRDEEYTLPVGAVAEHKHRGLNATISKIDEVKSFV